MTTFRVRYRMSYFYDRPVEFGLHQLPAHGETARWA